MRYIIPVLLCLVACGQKAPPFEPISPEPLTLVEADRLQVEAVCRFVADCTRTQTYEECSTARTDRKAGCQLDDELARRCIERWRDAKCIAGLEGDDWGFFHEHKTEILGPDPDPCDGAFHSCPMWYPATVDVPPSTANTGYAPAVRVTLDRSNLSVDGIRVTATETVDGVVGYPERFLSGSLITPLFDTLEGKLEDQRSIAQRSGRALDATYALGVARDVPFGLVGTVLHTASRAGYERVRVEVAAPLPHDDGMMALYAVDAWPAAPFPALSTDRAEAYSATVVVGHDGYEVVRHDRRTSLLSSPNTPAPQVGPAREETGLPCAVGGCVGPDAYDTAGLTAQMMAAKSACVDCEQVLIVVEPTVPWEVVVRTLDVTREHDGDEVFPRPRLIRSL